jgi:hypothetical protein
MLYTNSESLARVGKFSLQARFTESLRVNVCPVKITGEGVSFRKALLLFFYRKQMICVSSKRLIPPANAQIADPLGSDRGLGWG